MPLYPIPRRQAAPRSRLVHLTMLLLLAAAPLALGPAREAGAQSAPRQARRLPRPPLHVAVPESVVTPIADATRVVSVAAAERLAGFERRRSRGGGTFFGPEELGRQHLARLSDLMRLAPGVKLVHLGGLGYAVASSRPDRSPRFGSAERASACYFDILLDGVRLTTSHGAATIDIDDFSPSRIAAVEIHRAPMIPSDLLIGTGSCGVVALWSAAP